MKSILIGVALLFLVLSCRKKQPQMNLTQNACDCAEEILAHFTIEEATAGFTQPWNRFTETDTVFVNRNVRFTAFIEDASYKWYIGSEIVSQKSFGRFFSDAFEGQDIPVTLVVKKKANTGCYPSDDGYDSITKVFHVAPWVLDTGTDYIFPPMEGTYRMKSAHFPDSFDVVFELKRNFQSEIIFSIENYDGEGANCTDQARLTGANYRELFSESPNNSTSVTQCEYLSGSIFKQMNGITKMHFTLYYPEHPNYQVLDYEGRKL